MTDDDQSNGEQRDQTALLHKINLSVVRTEEQVKSITRDLDHMRNNAKMAAIAADARADKMTAAFDAQLKDLATREAVDALSKRVDAQESNWVWLIRLVVGGPIAAALAYLGFIKAAK